MRLSPPVQFLSDNLKEQVQIPFVVIPCLQLGRLRGMKRLAVPKVERV